MFAEAKHREKKRRFSKLSLSPDNLVDRASLILDSRPVRRGISERVGEGGPVDDFIERRNNLLLTFRETQGGRSERKKKGAARGARGGGGLG